MNADVWKLYFNKDFEKALILFKQIIKSDENNILVLNAIAVCEYMLYHYKEALISINKAIDLVDDPKLLSTKASILTELGNEAQDDKLLSIAKDLFNEILVHERDAIILYNYGNCLNSLKQYKEAKIAYEESLSFDPNNEKVWNSLGNVYNELKVPQLGLQCFDKALTINPDLVHAIFNKGHTIFKYFGNAELGLNIMLESFKLDTNKTFELEFRYAYFWVAEAYLHLGDIINAIKMNNNGLRIHPTDSFFHLQKERIKNASSISS
ncbi:MAG: tetratricopeptide repeat protein [Bacteroidia bacterium]